MLCFEKKNKYKTVNRKTIEGINSCFNIKNNSQINGSEVPQIYIQRENVKRLKGFKKIFSEAVDAGIKRAKELSMN